MKGVGQPRLVQRFVGVGHVHAGVQQPAGEEPRRLRVSPVCEGLVCGFLPHVAAWRAMPHEWRALEPFVGKDAEGRDYVLPEILILVIPEHDHEVGVEVQYLPADAPETLHQPRPVDGGGGHALVVAILRLHRLRPVERVLQLFRQPFIAVQSDVDGKAAILVRGNQRRVVGAADADNFCHDAPPIFPGNAQSIEVG